jgi:hypothetical protein
MTAKLDGTNGLLQQYDYQTPTTGFSYTFAAGVNVLVMQPAGTLATGTVTMPAAPADGMTITVESTQQITALTVQGNAGQSLVNGTQTLRPDQPYSWVYRLSNTTWYPFAGATNSQIVSGVAQATTSGTSIGFTSIPSWVKRITVMFSGVSTSGTSDLIIQLGTGATPTYTTTGYLGSCSIQSGTVENFNTGYEVVINNAAASVWHGNIVIANVTSNTWSGFGVLGNRNAAGTRMSVGSSPLAAVLTAVRITTVVGTDTFDAGTINILYE